MATNFPTSLDTFVNPASTDTLDSATVPHAAQHDNINDAVLAVETALGANLANVVLPARSISTTAPLTGGGDLSANRTLAVSAGSTSAAGVLQLTDSTSSTSTTTAATPNSVKSAYDIGANKILLKMASGSYFRTPVPALGTLTITNQRAYYMPIYIPYTTTFDRITIATATGFSGTASVRLGIYNDTNGSPSTLLLDAGTVSATAANTIYEITISQSLNVGFYWLAFCQQTAPSTNSYAGGSSTTSIFNHYMTGTTSPAVTSNSVGYFQNSVTGAFSNVGTITLGTSQPYVWIRAA
jgi:hypothetical protein